MDFTTDNESLKASGSKIPALVSNFRRSASLRVRGEKPIIPSPGISIPFPSIAEREELSFQDRKSWSHRKSTSFGLNRSRSQASGLNHHKDEDLDSLDSFVSGVSNISSSCEHAYFAKNGTTFSGRNQKYVVHCPSHVGTPEEYLTPTQRANRSIRRLKSLLQLAKEKLVEKEQEIFKLTKEVVELKVFKASLNNSNFSEASSPSDGKDISVCLQERSCNGQGDSGGKCEVHTKDFTCDTYNDLSPIKSSFYFDDKNGDLVKLSPSSPPHGVYKISATPDYLLSSLADSGNFDDLASSVSLHSKDSIGLSITPDLRPLPEEDKATSSQAYLSLDALDSSDSRDREEERSRIVNMYENMLQEKKGEYEQELKKIVAENESKNIATIEEFALKLKEEEGKFEKRWHDLLKSSENEKIEIVDRFEARLEEEKKKYMENLMNVKMSGGKVTDMIMSDSYMSKIEEQKAVYETSLAEIKCRFENEKLMMEKTFDEAMVTERRKFEGSVADIKATSDKQIGELMAKIAELEAKYCELLPKYEEAMSRNVELENENAALKKAQGEQEERQRAMYLEMYNKGQEAEKIKHADEVVEFAHQAPERVSVPELLVQLKVTETELENLKDNEYRALHSEPQGLCLLSSKEAVSLWMLAARKAMYKRLAEAQSRPPPPAKEKNTEGDPEATLQFLKSAVYYFLTDHENQLGHLRAIESILGFSHAERRNIDKFFAHK